MHHEKQWHGSYMDYAVGFIASLILTTLSFYLVITKALPEKWMNHGLITLALFQALFQLRFFLHLGKEAKPKWESVTFYFMLLILAIVVFGSLWIMFDLQMRMMPEMEMR